jgi:hypothetical protein
MPLLDSVPMHLPKRLTVCKARADRLLPRDLIAAGLSLTTRSH